MGMGWGYKTKRVNFNAFLIAILDFKAFSIQNPNLMPSLLMIV